MLICDKCTRKFGEHQCFIPLEKTFNGESLSEWKKSRLVRKDETTCEFYKEETKIKKIKDFFRFKWYAIKRFFESIFDFFKYSVILRIKHGFDVRDSWSVCHSTAKFMLPRLRYMIDKEPQGTPQQFSDQAFIHKHNLIKYFTTQQFVDEYEVQFNAWKNVLESIYYSLDYVNNETEERFNYFYTNEFGERELDKKKMNEIHTKVDEGFKLLGLFFQNLWD